MGKPENGSLSVGSGMSSIVLVPLLDGGVALEPDGSFVPFYIEKDDLPAVIAFLRKQIESTHSRVSAKMRTQHDRG